MAPISSLESCNVSSLFSLSLVSQELALRLFSLSARRGAPVLTFAALFRTVNLRQTFTACSA